MIAKLNLQFDVTHKTHKFWFNKTNTFCFATKNKSRNKSRSLPYLCGLKTDVKLTDPDVSKIFMATVAGFAFWANAKEVAKAKLAPWTSLASFKKLLFSRVSAISNQLEPAYNRRKHGHSHRLLLSNALGLFSKTFGYMSKNTMTFWLAHVFSIVYKTNQQCMAYTPWVKNRSGAVKKNTLNLIALSLKAIVFLVNVVETQSLSLLWRNQYCNTIFQAKRRLNYKSNEHSDLKHDLVSYTMFRPALWHWKVLPGFHPESKGNCKHKSQKRVRKSKTYVKYGLYNHFHGFKYKILSFGFTKPKLVSKLVTETLHLLPRKQNALQEQNSKPKYKLIHYKFIRWVMFGDVLRNC